MNFAKKSLVILLLSAAAFSLFSYDYLEDPLVIYSSRSRGMGGAHAADTSDMSVLFSNPAGFQAVDTQMAFAELTLGLKGPVFDIADVVVNSLSGGSGMEDMLASDSTMDIVSGLYAGLNLTGPVYFGYVGNGLGLGFFQNTDLVVKESSPLTVKGYSQGGYSSLRRLYLQGSFA